MTRLLLDAFCCQGGASAGYARAGFTVIGVDRDPQPNYPYEFHQGNAIDFIRQYGGDFDAIHASPPCQFHSHITNAVARAKHVDLIPDTRAALAAVGGLSVIENVEGAKLHLVDPVRLCGSSFGLGVRRHRFFELTGFKVDQPACDHKGQGAVLGVYGNRELRAYPRPDGSNRGAKATSPAEASRVLGGVDWMTWHGMTQCLPPAYTRYLGTALMDALNG